MIKVYELKDTFFNDSVTSELLGFGLGYDLIKWHDRGDNTRRSLHLDSLKKERGVKYLTFWMGWWIKNEAFVGWGTLRFSQFIQRWRTGLRLIKGRQTADAWWKRNTFEWIYVYFVIDKIYIYHFQISLWIGCESKLINDISQTCRLMIWSIKTWTRWAAFKGFLMSVHAV